MMTYIVVLSDSLTGLVDTVNAKMCEGWVPVGGVSVTEIGVQYMQAMTKEG